MEDMSSRNRGAKRKHGARDNPFAMLARPCHRRPPMPCECGPGDHLCGKLATSIASRSPRDRRAFRRIGGGKRL